MKPTTQAISNNDNDKRAKHAGKTLQDLSFSLYLPQLQHQHQQPQQLQQIA